MAERLLYQLFITKLRDFSSHETAILFMLKQIFFSDFKKIALRTNFKFSKNIKKNECIARFIIFDFKGNRNWIEN